MLVLRDHVLQLLCPFQGLSQPLCPLMIHSFFLKLLNSQGPGFPVLHPLPSAQGALGRLLQALCGSFSDSPPQPRVPLLPQEDGFADESVQGLFLKPAEPENHLGESC